MKTYFKVIISEMSKNSRNSPDTMSLFHQFDERFATLAEVKKYLKERYTDNKIKRKSKIYIDGDKGEAIHVGWIYGGYQNQDWSHQENTKWWQEDWVEVREVKEETVLV